MYYVCVCVSEWKKQRNTAFSEAFVAVSLALSALSIFQPAHPFAPACHQQTATRFSYTQHNLVCIPHSAVLDVFLNNRDGDAAEVV